MAKLILVKHSLPQIEPQMISTKWSLSEEGIARCEWLVRELEKEQIECIFSSKEKKARETASLVAKGLHLDFEVFPGLHENDRTGFGFLPREEWKQRFRMFFANPDKRIIGNESANEALARFSRAVHFLLKERQAQNVAIIAHGTVITLFVAAHNEIEPFSFWEGLGLPSFVVLDGASFRYDTRF